MMEPRGRKRTGSLPSALAQFEEIRGRIGNRRPVLFLDYDGTLTPIVKRPELALLGDEMRETLRELAGRATVAVISGRALEAVRRLVGLDELFYSGSHGMEFEGPSGLKMDDQRIAGYIPDLDSAQQELQSKLSGVEGTFVERKKFSVAAHYRLANEAGREKTRDAVEAALAGRPKLRRMDGKKVFELRPALDWDKGTAIVWMLGELEFRREETAAIFIGDDITDEDAFRAVAGWGIGIVVRDNERDTAADYALENPEEVGRFLRALAASIPSCDE